MNRIQLDFNFQCTVEIGYRWLDYHGSLCRSVGSHEKDWSNAEEHGTKIVNHKLF